MTSNYKTTGPGFTGTIPQNYDRYLGPMYFEDYAIDVAARVDASVVRHALELCCGTGRLTRHLRKKLAPDAMLVASDLSEDMLAIAKGKFTNEKMEWRIIDAQAPPFDDNSLDLVVCCFGYMFVSDQVKAFAEAKRILRPGGSLLFATWGKLENNGASNVHRLVLKKYLGNSLPPMYKLPFSMNDPTIIEQQLYAAGFKEIRTEIVEKKSTCATSKEAAYGLVHGSTLYNELLKQPALLNQIITTVETELTANYNAGPMVAPMQAIISQAWK